MSIFPHQCLRVPARSTALAVLGLGAALAAAAWIARDEHAVSAASNFGRTDLDADGLTDQQELVIGTLAYRADTDGDGFSDLEERARSSDPLDNGSVPEAVTYGVGTCASLENGVVSMLSAVYLHDYPVAAVELELGIVYRGHALRFQPRTYSASRGFLYPGREGRDTLMVVEVAIPETLVRRLGQLNLFSIVRGTTPGAPPPVVSVLPLIDFSGVTVAVETRSQSVSSSGGGQGGVVYRPITGDQVPTSWNSGEICYQRTAPVGVNGVSVVHEIEAADCLEMDTYCSGSDCAAAVGSSVELPDPGALIGG